MLDRFLWTVYARHAWLITSLGLAVAACGPEPPETSEASSSSAGTSGDDCSAICEGECSSSLKAENGTGLAKYYCYEPDDSIDTRARKACESHFGVGACCIIEHGYSELQWGQCGQTLYGGTYHFHPDSHPDHHCDPIYVVGDVLNPGWCGEIVGNFLD
jgi:hypothetical protein